MTTLALVSFTIISVIIILHTLAIIDYPLFRKWPPLHPVLFAIVCSIANSVVVLFFPFVHPCLLFAFTIVFLIITSTNYPLSLTITPFIGNDYPCTLLLFTFTIIPLHLFLGNYHPCTVCLHNYLHLFVAKLSSHFFSNWDHISQPRHLIHNYDLDRTY